MTMILKLGLDVVKMYLYTENKFPSYSGSRVMALTDRQTDRHTDRQTHIHRPDWNYYLSAYAGGKNSYTSSSVLKLKAKIKLFKRYGMFYCNFYSPQVGSSTHSRRVTGRGRRSTTPSSTVRPETSRSTLATSSVVSPMCTAMRPSWRVPTSPEVGWV